jgi:hypothetical protein
MLAKPKSLSLFLFLFIIAMGACSRLMAPYDQYAYTQSTSAKVDALNLMEMATEDYGSHTQDIRSVQTELQKVYEYERHRPKNEFTVQMWQVILDSNEHSFGGFIRRWEQKRTLKPVYIEEKKKQVAEAFDKIVDLEGRKMKPSR